MSQFKVDLTNCDREPIHIPGQIQSHGFLVVLDEEYVIRFYSDNIYEFIPAIPTPLLGKTLQYLETLVESAFTGFITRLIDTEKLSQDFERLNPIPVNIGGDAFYLIISANAGFYYLEFEPIAAAADLDLQSRTGRSIAEILTHKQIDKLLEHTAKEVREIIRYDRVMIYRFASDGHGIVVAEDKNDTLTSWLGVHYPASDIPQQARALYKLNLTRQIANVNSSPSKISTAADNTEPLDLTYSQLRAVSPIHIQYLKNMGVASSFSISLIYNDELWGLIACHNYTPVLIDYRAREYTKLAGQILSLALQFRQDEVDQHEQDVFNKNLDKLARSLQVNDGIKEALIQKPSNLLNVVHSHGAVLVYEKKIIKIGITPDDEQLYELIDWLNESISEKVYYTNNLMAEFPDAVAYKAIASGIIVCVLSKKLEEYVIWFKPEQIHTITWAGNPDKPVEIAANGLMNISPRHSFEAWTQTVLGKSVHWTAEEIKSVTRLKEEVTYAINIKANAIRVLNERLRQAYDESETFSYTISHDLKNPIASIKGYAQLLIKDKMVMDRGQKMMERIVERADQMNLMINAVLDYSRIGRSELVYRKINAGNLINDIIKDIALIYDTKDLQVTVGETPDLYGDPIMMLQVFSNLIGNAVKYSGHFKPSVVHINGEVKENEICYSIKDNGLGIAAMDMPKIFELFNRMDNVKNIEGTGVGLAIVKRIMEKHHGRIWAVSELNEGSEFFIAFNK